MTDEERAHEYEVAYQTAIGRSCGTGNPMPEDEQAAAAEAREHVRRCEEAE